MYATAYVHSYGHRTIGDTARVFPQNTTRVGWAGGEFFEKPFSVRAASWLDV